MAAELSWSSDKVQQSMTGRCELPAGSRVDHVTKSCDSSFGAVMYFIICCNIIYYEL